MHPCSLELRDGHVCYRHNEAVVWNLPVASIRVIGEATTSNGPYVDDYYFCFATGPDSWYEASFYAEGTKEFLKSLGSALGYELQLRLLGSTDFESNVLWPPHLAGKPMFTFIPVPPSTWLSRLFDIGENKQWFSDDVERELASSPTSIANLMQRREAT
jgi:hypothetical protein